MPLWIMVCRVRIRRCARVRTAWLWRFALVAFTQVVGLGGGVGAQ